MLNEANLPAHGMHWWCRDALQDGSWWKVAARLAVQLLSLPLLHGQHPESPCQNHLLDYLQMIWRQEGCAGAL